MFFYAGPIVLILEIICLIHAHRNGADRKWFIFIIVLPLWGCIWYLINHFSGGRGGFGGGQAANVGKARFQEMSQAAQPRKSISELEKDVDFSGTFNNKKELGDAYYDENRLEDAIRLYESCLTGYTSEDPEVLRKLVRCYYGLNQYEKAVEYGERVKTKKQFHVSEERVGYAWALHQLGRTAEAEENFRAMDMRYSNYPHRIEYAKFLSASGKRLEGISLLTDLIKEIDSMDLGERKQKRHFYREIKRLKEELIKG